MTEGEIDALHKFNPFVLVTFNEALGPENLCIVAEHLLIPQHTPQVNKNIRPLRDKFPTECIPAGWNFLGETCDRGWDHSKSFIDDSLYALLI